MIEKNCKNCRWYIFRDSMRGKREGYCIFNKRWIGDTILCSAFGIADPVHAADFRIIPNETESDEVIDRSLEEFRP